MKQCITCKETKELESFYTHKQMADGRLNKCKECCKKQAKERENILRATDSNWVEKEKERGREKYKRLNYNSLRVNPEKKKKVITDYINRFPEKRAATLVTQKMFREKDHHLHHWSYKKEHQTDVISLKKDDHYYLHRFLSYDSESFQYKDRNGNLLDTKEKHLEYIKILMNEKIKMGSKRS
jgi:hypothetical protein